MTIDEVQKLKNKAENEIQSILVELASAIPVNITHVNVELTRFENMDFRSLEKEIHTIINSVDIEIKV